MNDDQIGTPPSRRHLLLIVGSALLCAGAVLLAVILPAEFHLDPLGIGKASGLLRLSSPAAASGAKPAVAAAPQRAHFYPAAFRSDTITIQLAAGGVRGKDELEWKVRMQAGQSLVYSWTVDAAPDEFYVDFHGQSDAKPTPVVESYRAGMAAASHGSLVAPFDGIHGWFLQNQTDHPVVVRLKLSGFYTMRPVPTAPE